MRVSCEPIGASDDEPAADPSATLSPQETSERLAVLYSSHSAQVHRYVLSLCGDHEIAQDVTQDVFETIARTVDDPARVTVAWLLRRARCRMIDVLRRRRNYRAKLEVRGEDQCRSDEESEIAERFRHIEAMAQLSPLHRTTLRLHYVDGLTVAEIAARSSRSTKGVECLITRARAALRSELALAET